MSYKPLKCFVLSLKMSAVDKSLMMFKWDRRALEGFKCLISFHFSGDHIKLCLALLFIVFFSNVDRFVKLRKFLLRALKFNCKLSFAFF